MCSIDGCAGKPVGRGLCQKHYVRWHRHGNPHFLICSPKHGPNDYQIRGKIVELFLTDKWGKIKATTIIFVKDLVKVQRYRWYLSNTGYVETRLREGKKFKALFLHKLILGEGGPEGDHINQDKLDNRRCNLRWATRSQNEYNKEFSHGKSKYKGVSWNSYMGKWKVAIRVTKNGIRERLHLGYFDDEKQAAQVYNEAAQKYHGEFAVPM